MNASLTTTNRPVIHLDITAPADLLVLPPDGQDRGDEAPADFGFATEYHRNDHARRRRSSRHSTKLDYTSKRNRNWLQGDPVRLARSKDTAPEDPRDLHRPPGFRSGRVELQKSFMSYLTNVRTIQKDYETYY